MRREGFLGRNPIPPHPPLKDLCVGPLRAACVQREEEVLFTVSPWRDAEQPSPPPSAGYRAESPHHRRLLSHSPAWSSHSSFDIRRSTFHIPPATRRRRSPLPTAAAAADFLPVFPSTFDIQCSTFDIRPSGFARLYHSIPVSLYHCRRASRRPTEPAVPSWRRSPIERESSWQARSIVYHWSGGCQAFSRGDFGHRAAPRRSPARHLGAEAFGVGCSTSSPPATVAPSPTPASAPQCRLPTSSSPTRPPHRRSCRLATLHRRHPQHARVRARPRDHV